MWSRLGTLSSLSRRIRGTIWPVHVWAFGKGEGGRGVGVLGWGQRAAQPDATNEAGDAQVETASSEAVVASPATEAEGEGEGEDEQGMPPLEYATVDQEGEGEGEGEAARRASAGLA